MHDDLQVITIPKEVIEKPPLVIYPEVIINTVIPEDVEEILLSTFIKI